jgi:hypothetical protein
MEVVEGVNFFSLGFKSNSANQHRIISIGLKSNAAISVVPMALVVNCRPVGSADVAGMGFNPCR